jgi:WD40 repeat protein
VRQATQVLIATGSLLLGGFLLMASGLAWFDRLGLLSAVPMAVVVVVILLTAQLLWVARAVVNASLENRGGVSRPSLPSRWQQLDSAGRRSVASKGALAVIVLGLMWNYSGYLFPAGSLQAMADRSPHASFKDFADEQIDTLLGGMVAEEKSVPWTKPEDVCFDDAFPSPENRFLEDHMIGNGSMRYLWVNNDLNVEKYRALFTINDTKAQRLQYLHDPNFKVPTVNRGTPIDQLHAAQYRSHRVKAMKQIVGALHKYHQTHQHLPPAVIYGPNGKPWHSWRVLILKELGHPDIYDEYDFRVPWDDPKNAGVLSKMPEIYLDPASENAQDTYTRYSVITGKSTAFPTRNHAPLAPSPRPTSGPKRAPSGSSAGTTVNVAAAPSSSTLNRHAVQLTGHASMVMGMSFSPDWKRLATASMDKSIKLWDAASGQLQQTLNGHTGPVQRVVFRADGQRLASASHDKTIKIWDAVTGQVVRTLEGHTAPVTNVAFSPNGKVLASISGGTDKTVKLWDVETGQTLHSMSGHSDGLMGLAFSPNGQHVASGSTEIKVWNARTGQEERTLKGHTAFAGVLTFSPDNQRLASASYDMSARVWDLKTGQETLALRGHSGAVLGIAFHPQGQRLASIGVDMAVKEWDAQTGALIRTLKTGSCATSLTYSSDGKRLGASAYFGSVETWDVAPAPPELILDRHTGSVTGVAFSPKGDRVASGSADQTVRVWEAATGKAVLTLKGHNGHINAVAFSPKDGRWLAVASSTVAFFGVGEVKLWDMSTGQVRHTFNSPVATQCVAFSPDGKRLAFADADKMLTLFDVESGEKQITFIGHQSNVSSITFSPDGRSIASAAAPLIAKPETVEFKLWDATTGQERRSFKGHQSRINCVVFSPDGQRLASASADQTVKLWDPQTEQEVRSVKLSIGPAKSIVFTPDSRSIVAAGGLPFGAHPRTEMKVLDANSGAEIRTLKWHAANVESIAISADGKRLVSGSADETVRVWDLVNGQETLRIGEAFSH